MGHNCMSHNFKKVSRGFGVVFLLLYPFGLPGLLAFGIWKVRNIVMAYVVMAPGLRHLEGSRYSYGLCSYGSWPSTSGRFET